MSTELSNPPSKIRVYRITVEGMVDTSWSDWLGGMQITSWQEHDGRQMSTLSGMLPDQAALRGLLIRLWDLNLIVHSMEQINTD